MPVNKHLKYFELSDFSAGVWTDPSAGTHLLMPDTGALQLDDAYPQVQGGLRAFFKSVGVTTSGVVNIAQEVCTGLYSISGYSRRTGAVGENGTVRFMTTWNNTTNVARIYRMDGTQGQVAWVVKFTSVTTADNSADRRTSSFARFVTTAGVDYCVVVLRSGLESSSRGMFTIQYTPGAGPPGSDGTTTRQSAFCGPLVVSQARIFLGENAAATAHILHWTATGDIVFSGATSGQLIPQPNKNMNGISLLTAIDPNQLLIGFWGCPWITVTGDINSSASPVREMGDGHYPGPYTEDPIRTATGMVFIEAEGSAYLSDGRTFQDLTPQLAPFSDLTSADGIKTLGGGTFLEGFLFLPGGYVMNEESKGWFKTSDIATGVISSDVRNGVIAATIGVNFTLRERVVSRGQGARNSSYTWRSAPFAQPDGTQSEVREVVIQYQAYTASTFVVTVTNHLGATATQTLAAVATGKHTSAIPILLRGDYCDVKIVASADNGSSEAPTIEKVRLGFGQGHAL